MSGRGHAFTLGFVAPACALLLVLGVAPAGAITHSTAADATVTKALDWLKTQQQAGGGFEVAGFPGFETPDAVLALAEAGQSGSTWNAAQALGAVQAVTKNGKSGLDALDAFAASGISAGQAAKLIVLDVVPLGLDPAAFDPSGNGVVDLVALVNGGKQPGGSYGAFNATLYAALADKLVAGSVPADTLMAIRAAQQADGGWNVNGDPAGTDVDPDTTGLAVEALIAGGAGPGDGNVARGLAYLANQQDADGSWKSAFDSGNPNSTALAMLAITAAGFDPASSCWRDTVARAKTGAPYTSPLTYVRAQQAQDGHIASPNDSFGVNTFGTTQSVQALLASNASNASWLPIARGTVQACAPAPTSSTTTTAPTKVLAEQVENGATAPGELPRTGAGATAWLAFAGASSLVSGLTLLRLRRRGA